MWFASARVYLGTPWPMNAAAARQANMHCQLHRATPTLELMLPVWDLPMSFTAINRPLRHTMCSDELVVVIAPFNFLSSLH